MRAIAAVAAALALVATPAAATPAAAATPPPGADDQPLQAAGLAAAQVPFVGVLEVRWTEAGTEHREALLVHGGNGSVVVRGGTNVIASDQQRLVQHAGRWDLLSPAPAPAATSTARRPTPGLKYELTPSTGPLVTGRLTHLIEVRHAGTLLERVYLDEDTGLLLRREQFDATDGRPARTIEFETLTIGTAGAIPSPPVNVHDVAPKAISARRLPDGVSAPETLAGGYQRVGLYQRGHTVQVVYSDGLYDLSVFQQPGRIDRAAMPAAAVVTFGQEAARRYSWTGNQVMVWEEDGMVYTAVSDAPLGQVVTAVGSLPLSHMSAPFVRRLRQVARALVQPFAA